MGLSRWSVAAVLLRLASRSLAHGHDDGQGMDMDMGVPSGAVKDSGVEFEVEEMPSYAGLDQHQAQIFAHIALMVLAWFFILPIGKSSGTDDEEPTVDIPSLHV
jgi:hypothetical protein